MIIFFAAFFKTCTIDLLKGAVSFPDEGLGEELVIEGGGRFTVFRRLKVKKETEDVKEGAVFKVRFRFKNLSLWLNKRLSLIPTPFLMGMEGFREKYWLVNEKTHEFMGLYQWESRGSAMAYPDSFIFKAMCKRSAPGTLSYGVIPNTALFRYVRDRQLK